MELLLDPTSKDLCIYIEVVPEHRKILRFFSKYAPRSTYYKNWNAATRDEVMAKEWVFSAGPEMYKKLKKSVVLHPLFLNQINESNAFISPKRPS